DRAPDAVSGAAPGSQGGGMNALSMAWAAVVAHPLFLIGLTLGVYQLGQALYERTRMALLHPLIVAIALLIPALWLLGLEYPVYRDAVFPLTMLLAPATGACGAPLCVSLRRIRQSLWPVMSGLMVGGRFVTILTLLLAWLPGADSTMLLTLAPKSLTTPIAMAVAEQVGGIAALAAGFVMYTAVLGALMGPWLLTVTGVTEPSARGMSLGLAAHAVGTSRALEEGDETGAFAALAMSLMGIATALLLPVAVAVWFMF